MSTGTITPAVNGTVIPASDHNSLRDALLLALVTRNSSGIATDLAGDLGTSSIRWKDLFIERMLIGLAASGLTIEEDSTDLIIKIGGAEKVRIKSTGLDAAGLIDLSVATAKLANLSVTTAKINNLAVTAAKIANTTITATQIATDTITESQIAANAISTVELQNDAVETLNIADGNVSLEKLETANTQESTASGADSQVGVGTKQIANQAVTRTLSGRPVWNILTTSVGTVVAGSGTISSTGGGTHFLSLVKAGTDLATWDITGYVGPVNFTFLDLAGTTGSTTYRWDIQVVTLGTIAVDAVKSRIYEL